MASASDKLNAPWPDDGPDSLDYTLDHLSLHSKGVGMVNLLDRVIGQPMLEFTMEGASTITVDLEDGDHGVLSSDLLTQWAWGDFPGDEDHWVRSGRPVDFYLGAEVAGNKVPFRLVKVSKQGTTLTLTFEERIVEYLRRHRGARLAGHKVARLSRAEGTRAMFVRMLAMEVKADGGVPVHIPELRKRQPIESREQAVSDSTRKGDGAKGLDMGADLEIWDSSGGKRKATDAEKANMQRALDVADSIGAKPKATLALVMACMIESGFRNDSSVSHKDADSQGILQVRDSTARDVGITNTDIEQCVSHFLRSGFWGKGGAIEIADKNPSATAGWVAQQTQGSAHPERYDKVRSAAQAIIRAYHGGGGRSNGERTYNKRYVFERGADENSWDAMGRLAEEVAWRRFIRKGRLWYVSEEYLFAQAPGMDIPLGHPAVADWSFDLDMYDRKGVAEVTLTAHANRWTALPGMVVTLRDAGPVTGRWLVSSVRKPLTDSLAEIRLTKPVKAKPEPRSQEAQAKGQDESGNALTGTMREKIVAVAEKSMTVHTKHNYYSQAGAMTTDPTPKAGLRSDCSQWVRAVYLKAGAQDPGGNTWEQAGKGKRTNAPKPGDLMFTANTGHVEIYVGGGRTIGHGSPPIDYADVAYFPGHYFVTFDSLDGVNAPSGQLGRVMREM